MLWSRLIIDGQSACADTSKVTPVNIGHAAIVSPATAKLMMEMLRGKDNRRTTLTLNLEEITRDERTKEKTVGMLSTVPTDLINTWYIRNNRDDHPFLTCSLSFSMMVSYVSVTLKGHPAFFVAYKSRIVVNVSGG